MEDITETARGLHQLSHPHPEMAHHRTSTIILDCEDGETECFRQEMNSILSLKTGNVYSNVYKVSRDYYIRAPLGRYLIFSL